MSLSNKHLNGYDPCLASLRKVTIKTEAPKRVKWSVGGVEQLYWPAQKVEKISLLLSTSARQLTVLAGSP